MSTCGVKTSREEEDSDLEQSRIIKAKRHDIEIPTAEVDIKLAEKLDNLLRISGDSRKPKFLTNRPRPLSNPIDESRNVSDEKHQNLNSSTISTLANTKLKRRNLTKDELKERMRTRYDTLVPELDPKRSNVKVVKVLTVGGSLELGEAQAKKQMEQQLELNSVSGNRNAHLNGMKSFVFNDGYEMPMDGEGRTTTIRPGHKLKNLIASRVKKSSES